jgi:uncharacterized membrane protein
MALSEHAPGRMERLVSTCLRVGIVLDAILIVVGVVLLAHTGQTGYGAVHGLAALLNYSRPGSPGHFPTTPGQVVRDTLAGKPFAIIELGVLVLLATPTMRVALSVLFFAAERDRLYVVVTLLVLAVLVASYLLGLAAG